MMVAQAAVGRRSAAANRLRSFMMMDPVENEVDDDVPSLARRRHLAPQEPFLHERRTEVAQPRRVSHLRGPRHP
jgi:hypothetical protein